MAKNTHSVNTLSRRIDHKTLDVVMVQYCSHWFINDEIEGRPIELLINTFGFEGSWTRLTAQEIDDTFEMLREQKRNGFTLIYKKEVIKNV